ncbi:MAG: hypothetical protein HRT64_14705, partial [Erythrobacter sp.]|nr:hypothetical protein [Erythrobacter sp.]
MTHATDAPDQQHAPRVRAEELAQIVQGELVGNPDVVLSTLAPIEAGGEGALTFIRAQNFAKRWADSKCQAALVTKGIDVPDHNPDVRALIFVEDADIAVVRILEMIDPGVAEPAEHNHASASIDPAASVDPSAKIGPGYVVLAGASIGPGTVLMANVYVGGDAHIGSE